MSSNSFLSPTLLFGDNQSKLNGTFGNVLVLVRNGIFSLSLIDLPLRFYKGFTNLRERTSGFRHFYLARRAQIST